ncbi:type 1 fimbrial protein [Pseudomonas sp. KCJK9016]|uniref:type 1 fimbrial protein n=1 Tax=Pseudomonas sp. KCJK9016 TaxID=3344556 RepID=UPI003906A84B
MKVKLLSTALLVAMVTTSYLSTASAQGVINFKGRVFGAGCQASSAPGATMALSGCPSSSRNNIISAQNVVPALSAKAPDGSSANVKLVHDTGRDGAYFDQQYILVDKAGQSIRSGSFLITMVVP